MFKAITVPFSELRVGMYLSCHMRDGSVEAYGRVTKIERREDGTYYTVDYGDGNIAVRFEDAYRLSHDSSIGCAVPVQS
jgi:hypothetical protein